ncbi:MAG TPA: DUF6340 family protein [Candidatus Brocadiia bacterium]|nr:DUF6340 family protein [Candidatus Brocadiia bacterium]
MKITIKSLFSVIVLLIAAGCGSPQVMITSRASADIDTAGIKTVAVVDVTCDGQGNLLNSDAVVSEIINQLSNAGYYDVIERQRVQKVQDELARGGSAIFDSSTSAQIGKQLAADSVIFGSTTYNVEAHSGMVKRQMPTGRLIPQYDPGTGQTIQVPETQLVDVPTMTKKVNMRGDFRMVKVETGRIIASQTEQFSDSAPKSWTGGTAVAEGQQAIASLPADADMVNAALTEVVRRFVWKISPHDKQSARYLLKGENDTVSKGTELALKGNWDEAVTRWQAALEINAGDAAALNNLAVAAERASRNEEAWDLYQKASSAAPDNDEILANKSDFKANIQ